jgi:hypothetical protein
MRATGCNPVSPWKCALVWGLLGVFTGFAIGTAILAEPARSCTAAPAGITGQR